MKIDVEVHQKKKTMIAAMADDRMPWWNVWRDIATYYIPKRYTWLMSPQERTRNLSRNPAILDGTGTSAGRVLAAGIMSGLTSPSRPWFRLRLAGFEDDADHASRVWLDIVERRMMLIMAESNFYNALAVMYLDLVFFGTAAMLIYDDYYSVIRCYNPCLGEYYLGQSYRQQVDTFARELSYKVYQCVQMFGEENVSDTVREKWRRGGSALMNNIDIIHLIEPNDGRRFTDMPASWPFVEYYWEASAPVGNILARRGYYEMPGVFPRWELTGNDNYGTSPGMDALGDVIQVQHETKRKGQSLDYLVRPPMVMDVQLQHRPTALLPGGQTFVAGVNNVGAKPAYQITPPLRELTEDIREVQARIRGFFSNDLFRMISELDTVRSATEIEARREEKLVLLGPFLERFENEALDPAIMRIYQTATRARLIPPPPSSVRGKRIEVQYVSILSSAQTAVGVIPTERFLQLVGNISPIYPGAVNIPNFDELLRDYGRDIGVKAKNIHSREEVERKQAALAEQQQAREAAVAGETMVDAGEALSKTEVGGGQNALQLMMGR